MNKTTEHSPSYDAINLQRAYEEFDPVTKTAAMAFIKMVAELMTCLATADRAGKANAKRK